ncbi:MAG TPA: hypothetical protein VFE37_00580 [Chloroflexota bacterium]|nr:hypothetical protein [Chloroflexota bacterium]
MRRCKAAAASGAALALFLSLIGHSLAGDTTYGLVDDAPQRSPSAGEGAGQAVVGPPDTAPSAAGSPARPEQPPPASGVASAPAGPDVALSGGAPAAPGSHAPGAVGYVVGGAPGGGSATGPRPRGLHGAVNVGAVPPAVVAPAPTSELRVAVVPPRVSTVGPSSPPSPSASVSPPLPAPTGTPAIPTSTPFVSISTPAVRTSTPAIGTATPVLFLAAPTVAPPSGGSGSRGPIVSPPGAVTGPAGAGGAGVLASLQAHGGTRPGGASAAPGALPCGGSGGAPPGSVTGGMANGACGGGGGAVCERPSAAASGSPGADTSCEQAVAHPAAPRASSAPAAPSVRPPRAPAEEVASRRVQRPALAEDEMADVIGAPARAGGLPPLAAALPLSGLGALLTAGSLWLRRRD